MGTVILQITSVQTGCYGNSHTSDNICTDWLLNASLNAIRTKPAHAGFVVDQLAKSDLPSA